ncbi:MAG TPA: polysaccharide pyruvyl transferase family protein [Pseudonocardiaceae bacterium]|jgi:polysaccharide pyruvyl transferase WcaK-like protein|nr:polysaccharide pyruvyl transferase family protein [Pseudonocardiaceae bacterium]
MITRPKYYLVSCVGAPNYGDELITATWLRYLAKHAPDADVVVDCIRPSHAWSALAGLHPRTRFTDTLWMLCVEQMGKGSAEIIDAITGALGAADRPAELSALVGSDVVHLVGGGLLNSLYPWNIGLLAGVVAAAAESGGRSGATGQGICPQEPDVLPLLRELMSRLTVADVRDEPSATLLALDGLRASADDVFLEPHSSYYRWTEDAPEVMVCAQSDIAPMFNGSADATTVSEFVLRTLRAWDVPAERIGFFESFHDLDHQVHDLVKEQLPGVDFYSVAEILDDGLPARSGQTWISTRFHPHLMAAAAGLGGLAVSVRPDYYDVKHQSLIDQGSGWRFAALDSVPERPTGGGFSAASRDLLRERKLAVANALYQL